ncbi:hypothetical protein [Floridanema evergladense]|uniref:Uncharacterized protein n=1 Tax=Floridaenema evergladense BLCC-F167 TaxID=3153639 RepID=A0ABV4WRU7_9CYAN
MRKTNPFENSDLKQLQLFLYLIPVFGVFPSLWTLYCRQAGREEMAASRLSVTLAFGWLLGYILLAAGADSSESWKLPLLVTNSLFTSGYFLVSTWLMFRLWQRQSLRLPLITRISERVVRKHLP